MSRVEGWKTLVCGELVEDENSMIGWKRGCGLKFGKVSTLRDHQRKAHGKKFATESDVHNALVLAKQLVTEILKDENLVSYMDFLDCGRYGTVNTDFDSFLAKRLMCFLEEIAIKELD